MSIYDDPDALPLPAEPLLFLDYDGTLAPIVEEPMEAFPRPEVPALLAELDAAYPVWIVTGRHLRDIDVLLPEPALPGIGLHGAQQREREGAIQDRVPERLMPLLDRLRSSVPEGEGIRLEEKGPVFAVHYRGAEDPGAAEERLAEWIGEADQQLDVLWGKSVVEIRARETTKGHAVREIAQMHPGRAPVYLGDDVTDEDAFEELEDEPEAVTVKVGEGESGAAYRLRDPEAVVAYLRRFVREE